MIQVQVLVYSVARGVKPPIIFYIFLPIFCLVYKEDDR